METLGIKKGMAYKYDAKSLKKETIKVLDEIVEEINKNEYQYKDEHGKHYLSTLYRVDWEKMFERSSKRTLKRFQKYIGYFRHKKSLKSINLLLHFMHTRVMAIHRKREQNNVAYKWWNYPTYEWFQPTDVKKVVLIPPQKELDIQNKRDKWKEAQAIADQLFKEYNDEKGDYYKNKLKDAA